MKIFCLLLLVNWSLVGVAAAQPAAGVPAASTNVPAASPAPPPAGPVKRSAAELEKLVLPIALHPDPLIAILLPASVYPLEVVQAARFVKDTNNIPKVDAQPWDDNVKACAQIPELIAQLDADLPWTMELGDAFLNQPKELLDTIQDLRLKANKAGTLQSSAQQIVTVTNIVVMQTNITEVTEVTKQIVQVAPADPQIVYVPSYPPTVYYPPPYYVYNPYAPLVTFGVGMAAGAILANNCNWGHSSVDIDIDRNVNRNSNRNTSRSTDRASSTGARSGQQQWKPDQNRVNQSGAKASTATRDARGWGSSTPKASTSNLGARPSTGNTAARPSTGNTGTRPSTGNNAARPSAGNTGARPSTPNAGARPSGGSSAGSRPSAAPSSNRSSGSAFGGASSSGSSARSSSSRGASSRGGGGRSGGGGGRR